MLVTTDTRSPAQAPTASGYRMLLALLPVVLALFVSYLSIGMQLPVLPLHLHDTLDMGTVVVGLVIGSQFVMALLSRAWAGNFADMRGAKRATILGCLVAAASGLSYLASLAVMTHTAVSVGLLLVGRVVLALGESLIAVGVMGWAIGRVGPQNAGKALVWVGIAIYGAFALGAPMGVLVNRFWGFAGVAAGTVLIPLLALALIGAVRGIAPSASQRTPFYRVLGTVWIPGMGLALSSVGFGLVMSFTALLFAARNWEGASLAFTAFGVVFIAARILFGHLPDQVGGAKVALVSVGIEAIGLLVIWQADSAGIAYLGAGLTGFGYSLAFPGFGVEAVRRAPPQTRSLAMGAYVAFMDIALGVTTPLAGALAAVWGVPSVYLAGGVVVALSSAVAIALQRHVPREGIP